MEEISLDATVKYEEYQAKVLTSRNLVLSFSLNQNIKPSTALLYRLFEEFTTEELIQVFVNHNGLVIELSAGISPTFPLESGNHPQKQV